MQIEYEFEVISYQRLSPEQTTHFTLTSNCKIGRSSDCDLQLPDPEKILSSKHARVELINGQYYIWDLSTNGLFINNGEDPLGKEEYHKLKDGDLLSLGDYELAVKRLPDRPVEEFASPTERIPAEEKAIPPIPMAPKMEEPPFPNGSEFNINEELEADVALAPVLSNFSAGIDDNVSSADIAIPSDWNFNFDPGLESARPNETAALKKELVEPFHSHETQAMNSPETQAMNSAETKQFNSAETQAM
ncbi:MAG: FHA domain-containing protein, partial [Psychromonas sp.]|nr:FHA domain-containing protein [Psychromonas sp.]